MNTPEDAVVLAHAVREYCHSSVGALGFLSEYIEDYDQNPQQIINIFRKKYEKFMHHQNNLRDQLLDTYSTYNILLHNLLFYALLEIPGTFPLDDESLVVHRQNWKESSRKVSWSMGWYKALLFNIAQNAYRSDAKAMEVWAEETKAGRKIWIDIFFDNDGADPDVDIVQNGFQRGVSHHEGGEGIGMAHHAQVLREHYGGTLTLEYRTGQDGNRVNGARVRLRLPIAR